MTRRITPTYTLLNQVTLAAAASRVTFSNLPQNFADLVFVYNGQTADSGNFDLVIRLNDDFNTTSTVTMFGTGSSFGSFIQTTANLANYGAGNRTILVATIFDYASIDKHKTGVVKGGSSNGVNTHALRYASTSAVTSFVFAVGAGTFTAGSTFAIYGVVA